MRNDTASIIKVDILEARLYQTHGYLTATERQLAIADDRGCRQQRRHRTMER